jgi:hypothetical protein
MGGVEGATGSREIMTASNGSDNWGRDTILFIVCNWLLGIVTSLKDD